MNRRTALLGGGAALAAVLAGCSNGDDGNGDGEDGDDGPLYDQDQQDQMLLSADAFPEGWERNDDLNENYDASYRNEDGSIVVLTHVDVHGSVDAADRNFDQSRDERSDPADHSLADEAFRATEDDVALTVFRHSNAVGQATAARETDSGLEPDADRSEEYAAELFENW